MVKELLKASILKHTTYSGFPTPNLLVSSHSGLYTDYFTKGSGYIAGIYVMSIIALHATSENRLDRAVSLTALGLILTTTVSDQIMFINTPVVLNTLGLPTPNLTPFWIYLILVPLTLLSYIGLRNRLQAKLHHKVVQVFDIVTLSMACLLLIPWIDPYV